MKHVKTLNKANLKKTAVMGGCGECQTSWVILRWQMKLLRQNC